MKKINQKGITLVALVVTIIVLLILAGVSISLIIGENGIIKRAHSTRDANDKATVEEEFKFAIAEAQLAYTRACTENSNVKRGFYFLKAEYYTRACKSANNISITAGDGASTESDSGTIELEYITQTGYQYLYSFKMEEPEKLIYISGPKKI